VSTNRTVVHLVAAQPAGGAELADPGWISSAMLQPGELIHPAGQLLEEATTIRADRVSR